MALTFAAAAEAADWRFTPSVGASATYTDNVNQTSTDAEKALILGVTPSFSLVSEGSRRVQASMFYSLSGVERFSDTDSTDLYHSLGAVGKAELVEDLLFLDGTANISQVLISLFGSPADATTNDSNRDTVSVYSLSPYIQKRFGTFANAEVRYTTGGAIFDENTVTDSTIDALTANLSSGTRFNDLSWALDYSNRQADNAGTTPDSTFERAAVTLGYALTRKFRVFGTYGEEWNDFLGATDASEGDFYSIGFGWSPSRRTRVETSFGERYFGRTYSFAGTYQTAASAWRLSYSEDVNDIAQQLLNNSGKTFWVCGGHLYEQPTPPTGKGSCAGPYSGVEIVQNYNSLGIPLSEVISYGLGNISIAGGVYVIKSLNAGVTWSKGRLSLGAAVFDIERISQTINGAEDRTQGVSGTASYRLTPRTQAHSTLSFARNSSTSVTPVNPDRDDDLVSLDLGLNHEFSEDLSGALTFRHQQRESNIANGDFDENSLSASANLRF